MSISHTSGIDYQSTLYGYSSSTTSKTTNTSDSFRGHLEESAVDNFKKRNPDRAHHVDQQVRAGKAVRERNGLDRSLVENMTMEEYQDYIYALLDTIPYDSTRPNDTTVISISDKGWEQMRKDPDYEAWILGYIVEDRSVRNPFYGWGNNSGNIIYERFGASIDEHRGESFSKAVFKNDSSDDDDDKEDWWIKRHKRMKKLLREQVERAMKKDAVQKAALQEEYARHQYMSARRQQSFLETGTAETPSEPLSEGSSAAAAATAYTSVMDLFGAMSGPMIDA